MSREQGLHVCQADDSLGWPNEDDAFSEDDVYSVTTVSMTGKSYITRTRLFGGAKDKESLTMSRTFGAQCVRYE